MAIDSTETLRLVDSDTTTEMEHETVSGLHFLFHDSFGKTFAAMRAESHMAYYHTIETHRSKVLALVGSWAIGITVSSQGGQLTTPSQGRDGLLLGGFLSWRSRIDRLLSDRLWNEALRLAKRLLDHPDLVPIFSPESGSVVPASAIAAFTIHKLVKFTREHLILHKGKFSKALVVCDV